MNSRLVCAILAGAMTLGTAASADEAATHWRLFVADQEDGKITAVDLGSPENRWTFEVAGPAKLYPTAGGRGIVAVQSGDDRVDFLSTGIVLESHGDHSDIAMEHPAQLPTHLTGPRPFHVVTHGQDSAINFDRGGYVAFLSEADILAGEAETRRFKQQRAHHGFAVRIGDRIVGSVASDAPVEGNDLPPRVGLAAFDDNGAQVGEMQTCTDLHGEAFSGQVLIAGCREGIAVVREAAGEAAFDLLPYPDGLPEEMSGTLLGSAVYQVFLGSFGADGVVIIDPADEPHYRYVELPYRRVDFVMDSANPQFAYILTEDGMLHRLDLLKAQIDGSAPVTDPYSMDGHWRDPRPRMAMAGDRLVLTDPLKSVVRLIDTTSLTELSTIPVDGLPYNVVAVGGSGLQH